MCDGASGHNFDTSLVFANEELKKRNKVNYIPKVSMNGVPNTTFTT